MNPLLVIPKLFFYLFACFLALGTIGGALLQFGQLVTSAVSNLGAAVIANWMCFRLFERLPLSAAGYSLRPGWLRNIALGLLAGAGLALLLIIVPVLLGAAHWEADHQRPFRLDAFLTMTGLILVGAAGEELLIRGYFLQVLARPISPAGAVLFTSTIFAILHGANEGVTNLALVNTGLYGAVLGYALLRSRDLWFPTAIHFAWNWLSIVAGVPLSGFKLESAGIVLRPSGSELLTGGAYGPEASALGTAMAVVLFAVVHWLPVAQGEAPLLGSQQKES